VGQVRSRNGLRRYWINNQLVIALAVDYSAYVARATRMTGASPP
jgi:hypothetical protein